MSDIKEIELRNFIFTHDELSQQAERKFDYEKLDNIKYFLADFGSGRLDRYKGTFVAYQHGIFAGQFDLAGKKLYDIASVYYGHSSLTVFKVPDEEEKLEDALKLTISSPHQTKLSPNM